MSKKNLSAERIANALIENPALFAEVVTRMAAIMNERAAVQTNWYDMFVSEHTEVTVKTNTVQVKVERGHSGEWKPQLRAAGFRWSFKNRVYWAWLDDEKRAEIAARNAENDALTEGMTDDEKRAFWAERRAARKSA